MHRRGRVTSISLIAELQARVVNQLAFALLSASLLHWQIDCVFAKDHFIQLHRVVKLR